MSRKNVRKTWDEEDDNNKEVVIMELKRYGNLMRYVSEELRNDEDVVIEAVKRAGSSIQYCSEELRNRRDIVIKAVRNNGFALQYCSEEMKKDVEVATFAVRNTGHALRFVCEEMKNQREVVLEAIKRYSKSLKFASSDLKNNEEFMTQATLINPYSIKYASETIRNSTPFVLEILQNSSEGDDVDAVLCYVGKDVLKDEELFLSFVDRFGIILKHAPEKLKNDESFVRRAIQTYPSAIRWSKCNDSKDFAFEVIRIDPICICFLSNRIRNDIDVCRECFKLSSQNFEYFGPEVLDNKEFIMSSLKVDGNLLRFASNKLRMDPEVAVVAGNEKRSSLQYFLSSEIKDPRKRTKSVISIIRSLGDITILLHSPNLEITNEILIEAMSTDAKRLESIRRYNELIDHVRSSTIRRSINRENIINFVRSRDNIVESIRRSINSENVISIMRYIQVLRHDIYNTQEMIDQHRDIGLIALQSYIQKYREEENTDTAPCKIGSFFESIHELEENMVNYYNWDKPMILEVMKLDGMLLRFFEGEMDKEIIFEAIKQNKSALKHVCIYLASDQKFMEELVDYYYEEYYLQEEEGRREWVKWMKNTYFIFSRKGSKSVVSEREAEEILGFYISALRRYGMSQNERDSLDRIRFLRDDMRIESYNSSFWIQIKTQEGDDRNWMILRLGIFSNFLCKSLQL